MIDHLVRAQFQSHFVLEPLQKSILWCEPCLHSIMDIAWPGRVGVTKWIATILPWNDSNGITWKMQLLGLGIAWSGGWQWRGCSNTVRGRVISWHCTVVASVETYALTCHWMATTGQKVILLSIKCENIFAVPNALLGFPVWQIVKYPQLSSIVYKSPNQNKHCYYVDNLLLWNLNIVVWHICQSNV